MTAHVRPSVLVRAATLDAQAFVLDARHDLADSRTHDERNDQATVAARQIVQRLWGETHLPALLVVDRYLAIAQEADEAEDALIESGAAAVVSTGRQHVRLLDIARRMERPSKFGLRLVEPSAGDDETPAGEHRGLAAEEAR